MIAMLSIIYAMIHILVTDIGEIITPTKEKTLMFSNLAGLPYFYGIASFMFEGNAVQLDIYSQMEYSEKNFTASLGNALLFATGLIVLLGSLSYSAFGQYTESLILMNLKPTTLTYVVWIFYSIGILCSYCLMVTPTFKILKTIPLYSKIPDCSLGRLSHIKTLLTRALVVIFCCSLAYKIPNLG
jgi:solute carrier family 36 (proton-coupled amino acid transporter)